MTTTTTATTATSKTLKTLAAISGKISELANQDSALVRVLFKPVTHKIWITESNDDNNVPLFCDMYGDQIQSAIAASIIQGTACEYRATEISEGRIRLTLVVVDDEGDFEDYDDGDGGGDCQIDVSPKHIAELTVLPGPLVVTIPGMTYKLTLRNDVIEVYGCKIDKTAIARVVSFLTSNLGYSVSLQNMTIDASKPALNPMMVDGAATRTTPEEISSAVASMITACQMQGVIMGKFIAKLKPVTDSVWRRNEVIVDANSEGLTSRILPLILDGNPIEFSSCQLSYGNIYLRHACGHSVSVRADYLLEFTTPATARPAPTLDLAGSLGYKIVWQPGNGLNVGCQTINAADDLLTVLAEYLGYKIVRSTTAAAAA